MSYMTSMTSYFPYTSEREMSFKTLSEYRERRQRQR